MTFPDSKRVIYQKNPLGTVICQLRFPPVLRIDADVPADFQDRIRHEYPLFEDRQPQDIVVPPQIAKALSMQVKLRGVKQGYQFSSNDNVWQVVLVRDFLALTTTKYQRWEDFKRHLEGPLGALIDIYKPEFYSRIGLRYQDIIKRSDLGLKEREWSELLQPHITGELSSKIAPSIKEMRRELLVALEGGTGYVRIHHGMIEATDSSEICYSIDADFYTDQRTEVGNAIETLDRYNREAGRLFRWCITDLLHNALGPQPL